MFAPSNSIGAVHEIVEAGRSVRHAEADDARHAIALARCNLVARVKRAAGAIVPPRRSGLLRPPRAWPSARPRCSSSSRRGHRRRGARPSRDDDRAAPTGSTGRIRPPTSGPSSQSRPSQRRPSRIPSTISGRRPLEIGVLDAQDEDAAVPSREQPVEERRARAADVQVAGG